MPTSQSKSARRAVGGRRVTTGIATRSRGALIAAGVAVVVAVPVGISVPAQAGEPPLPPAKTVGSAAPSSAESAAVLRAQDALHQLVERITTADKPGKQRDPSTGLAGVVLDPDRGLLNLYWHGRRSAGVDKEIATGRTSGLQVRTHSAPYTLSQLTAERDRLATRFIKNAKPGDPKVMSIGPKPDGSGLQIGVDPSAASMKLARTAINSTVGIDIVAGDAPTRTSRYLDTQPYWGGSYMEKRNSTGGPVTGACTMGFSTTRGGNPYNMLTAAHCGGYQWTLSSGAHYGWVQPVTTAGHDYDAQLINVAANQGVIYDGPSIATGDTTNGKPVVGSGQTFVGDRLCTSGSFSGTTCNIRAMSVGQTINVGGYGQVKQVVLADQQDGIAAVGNGDSGGPVFALTGLNNSQAIARGTISAIPGNTAYYRPCQGVPGVPNDQAGRHCSYRFYFPDIRYQLGAYPGASLVTF